MAEPQTLSYESTETKLSGVGIGTIALQVLGVYCIAMALTIVPAMARYFMLSGNLGATDALLVIAQVLVNVAIGFALIFLAPRISFWLFRGNPAGIMVGPVTSPMGQSIQAIAFSVLGLYLMAITLPRLAVEGFFWIRTPGIGLSPMDVSRPFVTFLVGLILFLQSKALSRLWHRLRDGPAPLASIPSDSDQA